MERYGPRIGGPLSAPPPFRLKCCGRQKLGSICSGVHMSSHRSWTLLRLTSGATDITSPTQRNSHFVPTCFAATSCESLVQLWREGGGGGGHCGAKRGRGRGFRKPPGQPPPISPGSQSCEAPTSPIPRPRAGKKGGHIVTITERVCQSVNAQTRGNAWD